MTCGACAEYCDDDDVDYQYLYFVRPSIGTHTGRTCAEEAALGDPTYVDIYWYRMACASSSGLCTAEGG